MTAPHSPLDADVKALVEWLTCESHDTLSSYRHNKIRTHLTTVKRMAARIAELERERDAEFADKLRWRKAFNSVTPGGSEYMDPEVCVAWCRRIQSEMHEAKKRVVLLEREAGGFSGPLGEVPSTARRK